MYDSDDQRDLLLEMHNRRAISRGLSRLLEPPPEPEVEEKPEEPRRCEDCNTLLSDDDGDICIPCAEAHQQPRAGQTPRR